MNHDLLQKFRSETSERSKTSKNSLKIVVILQNFGRFLSLRPDIVLISPKFPNYRVFRENLVISEIDQSLGSIWHFPKKVVPKEQSSTLFFSEKSKNARILFDHSFCLHWCLSYCCCRKIFYI